MLRLPALLVVAAVSALDFQEEQVEWVKPEVTGAVPEPREGHCAHLVQQSLYIYGGSTHTPMDLHDMMHLKQFPVTIAGNCLRTV